MENCLPEKTNVDRGQFPMLPSRAVNIHIMFLQCLNDLLLWVGVRRRPSFLYVCLFVVFRPSREFLTHMETSPLPVQ